MLGNICLCILNTIIEIIKPTFGLRYIESGITTKNDIGRICGHEIQQTGSYIYTSVSRPILYEACSL